jgi:hypothetical protein
MKTWLARPCAVNLVKNIRTYMRPLVCPVKIIGARTRRVRTTVNPYKLRGVDPHKTHDPYLEAWISPLIEPAVDDTGASTLTCEERVELIP